jgi:hypothetical protein
LRLLTLQEYRQEDKEAIGPAPYFSAVESVFLLLRSERMSANYIPDVLNDLPLPLPVFVGGQLDRCPLAVPRHGVQRNHAICLLAS